MPHHIEYTDLFEESYLYDFLHILTDEIYPTKKPSINILKIMNNNIVDVIATKKEHKTDSKILSDKNADEFKLKNFAGLRLGDMERDIMLNELKYKPVSRFTYPTTRDQIRNQIYARIKRYEFHQNIEN